MMSNDKTKYSHPMPRQMPFEFVLTVNCFFTIIRMQHISRIFTALGHCGLALCMQGCDVQKKMHANMHMRI